MAKATEILNEMQEKLTNYMGVISSDHAYIHKGIAFSVIGETGSISAGETYKFRFTTPDISKLEKNDEQRYIHWRPAYIGGTDSGFSYKLHKDSTSVSGGTAATIINCNQNSTKTSNMQGFYVGSTVTEGTVIQGYMNGTGATGSAGEGGGGGAEHERVLAPNTEYTVTIKNESGSTASTAIYVFFWYEEKQYGN